MGHWQPTDARKPANGFLAPFPASPEMSGTTSDVIHDSWMARNSIPEFPTGGQGLFRRLYVQKIKSQRPLPATCPHRQRSRA